MKLSLPMSPRRDEEVRKLISPEHSAINESRRSTVPPTCSIPAMSSSALPLVSLRKYNNFKHQEGQRHDIRDGHSNEFDPEKCFERFHKQATESIRCAYEPEQSLRRAASNGVLTTSLPEDVISLLQTFVSVLDSCYLSKFSSSENSNNININRANNNTIKSARSSNMKPIATSTVELKTKQHFSKRDKNDRTGTCTVLGSVDGGSSDFDDETCIAMQSYFIEGMLHVIRTIRETHCSCRWIVVVSSNNIEDTCAAANDFFRLSEKVEQFTTDSLLNKYPFLNTCVPTNVAEANNKKSSNNRKTNIPGKSFVLISEFNELANVLLHDAVFAAERTQIYIMHTIQKNTTLAEDFFSRKWENEYTSNEVALALIDIFEERLRSIQRYLANEFLFNKAIIVCAKGMVCFYIRCLVYKADTVGRRSRIHKRSMGLLGQSLTDCEPFQNHRRAMLRMKDDISIMSTYFKNKVGNESPSNSALVRIIANEMWILEVIHECLQVTSSSEVLSDTTDIDSCSSLESFIVVIHKRTGGNIMVTKFFVSDLWLLSKSQIHQRSMIRRTVDQIQPDLQMVTTHMHNRREHIINTERNQNANNSSADNNCMITTIPFGQLDEMLKVLYEDRVSQGLLPLCWMCLPRSPNSFDSDDNNLCNGNAGSMDVRLAKKIQNLTQRISDLPRHLMELPQMNRHHDRNNNEIHSNNDSCQPNIRKRNGIRKSFRNIAFERAGHHNAMM